MKDLSYTVSIESIARAFVIKMEDKFDSLSASISLLSHGIVLTGIRPHIKDGKYNAEDRILHYGRRKNIDSSNDYFRACANEWDIFSR